MTHKRDLYIDALTYKRNKAFGYNEYLFNLLNYFFKERAKLDFDNIYIICEESQQGDFSKFKGEFEIVPFRFSNILKRSWVQSFWNFFLPIKKEDVILSTANYSTIFKRCKHLLVIHDLLYLHGDWLKHRAIKYQRKFMVPRSIKLAEKIIAISNFTSNEIMHYFPFSEGKIESIYNYFNFEKFGKKNFNEKKTDSIIAVASNEYHKNTITLLKAFYEYKKKGGRFNLILIGSLNNDSLEKNEINQIIKDFPGSITNKAHISNEELAREYSRSSIYVSASFFEGLGMPIVEAMYFGLKLILPDEPSIFREISNLDAIYFNSKSYEDLALIFLSCESIKESNNLYNLERFNASNTSGKYIDLLNQM